eukprot:NODE_10182_length_343_cov_47.377551_g9271_i0.p1 GENE.NODE_10182_length_343_cov_47.377551_g9271_i0~~NODE_10182_length_343_cov_47.377551_g9271_i0.p1  ORF type:complete len:100 (+),score=19.44 NODE_10182_length_343_cov_47.377551_g9271_i0:34-300(+)
MGKSMMNNSAATQAPGRSTTSASIPLLVGAAAGGIMGFMMPMGGPILGALSGTYISRKVQCALSDCSGTARRQPAQTSLAKLALPALK